MTPNDIKSMELARCHDCFGTANSFLTPLLTVFDKKPLRWFFCARHEEVLHLSCYSPTLSFAFLPPICLIMPPCNKE